MVGGSPGSPHGLHLPSVSVRGEDCYQPAGMKVGLEHSLHHLAGWKGPHMVSSGWESRPTFTFGTWVGWELHCLWCLARVEQVLSSIFLSAYAALLLVLWQREHALVWSFVLFFSVGIPQHPSQGV